jgi:uncharacterized membrane protein
VAPGQRFRVRGRVRRDARADALAGLRAGAGAGRAGRAAAAARARGAADAGLALLFLYLSLETNSFLHWTLRPFQAGGLSVFWTLFALALVAVGIGWGAAPLRFAGLALFAVVVVKVFRVDLGHTPVVQRVIAFLIVGSLLLLGSFAYLKASRRFGGEES